MKKIRGRHFYLWFATKPKFEALEFSRGWDVWFLTVPTFGAAVRWTAMLMMPQKQDRWGAAHDTAWGLCSVPQHPSATKAPFSRVPGKLLLTHSSCFFFPNLLFGWFFSFSLPGTFFTFSLSVSLKCSGECNALCWRSVCRLENKKEYFALIKRWVNCLKFLHGKHIQIPAGRWKHGWYKTSLFHAL